MAMTSVQPGAAPANPCTHAQAAEFLAQYQVDSGMMPFTGAPAILNSLYGLTHVLAEAFNEANAINDSQLLRINPALIGDTFRSIRHLVALAAFFAEA